MCCDQATHISTSPNSGDITPLLKFGDTYAGKKPDHFHDTAKVGDIQWSNFDYTFGVYKVPKSGNVARTLRLFGFVGETEEYVPELAELTGDRLPVFKTEEESITYPRECLIQDKGGVQFACKVHGESTWEVISYGYSDIVVNKQNDVNEGNGKQHDGKKEPMTGLILRGNKYVKYGN